jgi:hypothetical protein
MTPHKTIGNHLLDRMIDRVLSDKMIGCVGPVASDQRVTAIVLRKSGTDGNFPGASLLTMAVLLGHFRPFA